MPHRREFWASRPLAAPLVAGTLLGVVAALLGLILGAVVVQAAGAALGVTMLPAAIIHLASGDDGGEDDDAGGGGGGPGRPPGPDVPPYPGLDWDEFDAARRDWERNVSSTGTPPV